MHNWKVLSLQLKRGKTQNKMSIHTLPGRYIVQHPINYSTVQRKTKQVVFGLNLKKKTTYNTGSTESKSKHVVYALVWSINHGWCGRRVVCSLEDS